MIGRIEVTWRLVFNASWFGTISLVILLKLIHRIVSMSVIRNDDMVNDIGRLLEGFCWSVFSSNPIIIFLSVSYIFYIISRVRAISPYRSSCFIGYHKYHCVSILGTSCRTMDELKMLG